MQAFGWILAGLFAVAVLAGAIAQRRKGRTGALWGIGVFVSLFALWRYLGASSTAYITQSMAVDPSVAKMYQSAAKTIYGPGMADVDWEYVDLITNGLAVLVFGGAIALILIASLPQRKP